MKLLLDENLHGQLKGLKGHDVFTVEDQGWRSVKNGELLRLMITAEFDAFIMLDTNIPYQENLKKYPIPIIVLRIGRDPLAPLDKFAPLINQLLKGRLKPGPHELTLN
jgi:hypothetical protein